ncbi:hypothetical protein BaRGS_00003449, partial [Batillaria attramentaria]
DAQHLRVVFLVLDIRSSSHVSDIPQHLRVVLDILVLDIFITFQTFRNIFTKRSLRSRWSSLPRDDVQHLNHVAFTVFQLMCSFLIKRFGCYRIFIKRPVMRNMLTGYFFAFQMMRNIFIKCFNTCRTSSESELSETWALRHMRFSPRLFDIKLFQRIETVAYFEDADMFVLAEGEAARCYNFQTGLDVNMALKGLMTLSSLLEMAACAQTEYDVMSAMVMKARHSDSTSKLYLTQGLRQTVFSS